jgi:hypothetical protein
MNWIQLILILGFLVFLFRVLANPASHQLRAWTKILVIIFVLIAILTILLPNTTNTIAHWVGVKRGADLLLYILTLAFIFSIFYGYIQSKRLQKRIVLLARKIAIIETNQKNHILRKK